MCKHISENLCSYGMASAQTFSCRDFPDCCWKVSPGCSWMKGHSKFKFPCSNQQSDHFRWYAVPCMFGVVLRHRQTAFQYQALQELLGISTLPAPLLKAATAIMSQHQQLNKETVEKTVELMEKGKCNIILIHLVIHFEYPNFCLYFFSHCRSCHNCITQASVLFPTTTKIAGTRCRGKAGRTTAQRSSTATKWRDPGRTSGWRVRRVHRGNREGLFCVSPFLKGGIG